MNHRTVTVATVVAGATWLLGVGLVLLAALDYVHDDLGPVGIVFVAIGHLVITRADLCRARERERDVFELGRDSVRLIR